MNTKVITIHPKRNMNVYNEIQASLAIQLPRQFKIQRCEPYGGARGKERNAKAITLHPPMSKCHGNEYSSCGNN